MFHSFDTEIAKQFGIEEAIILNNIYYWVEKNKANNVNLFEGRYWTYNSKRAFAIMFDYMNERQIKYTLNKLLEYGLIMTGNFNQNPMDRTLWYTLTDLGISIVQKNKICDAKTAFREDKNGKWLDIYNTNISTKDINSTNINYTDINVTNKVSTITHKDRVHNNTQEDIILDMDISSIEKEKEIILKRFEIFMDEYPKKASREKAKQWFLDNKPSEELLNKMLNSLHDFKRSEQWRQKDGYWIPLAINWLNDRRWEERVNTRHNMDLDRDGLV
jgi:hypothetical protein